MPFYRVRRSQQLPHGGQTFGPGSLVELPRKLAAEVSHLVDEVNADGSPLPGVPSSWAQSLETVREHERVSVLEQELDAASRRLSEAREADETAQLTAAQTQAELDAAGRAVEAITAALTTERQALQDREAVLAERTAKAAKKSPKTAPSGSPNPADDSAVPSKE